MSAEQPSPPPDVEAFRADARSWLARNRADAPRDYGAILPPELADAARRWQMRLFDAGYAGVHWPTDVGGRGLGAEHQSAWIAECAAAGVPAMLNMVGCVLAGQAILAHGDDDQRDRHLRPTLTGEVVWCQLFSEPGAGSDLASLSTRAERDGDHYVVSGQKVWCSNGRVADRGILLARTDPAAPRHAGITFFLLDMASPGVEVRPLRQMNGDAEFDEVFLDEVRVPVGDRLGDEGQGWAVAMSALTNERGHIGASGRSLQRRLDALVADAAGSEVDADATVELWCRGMGLLAMGRRQGPAAGVLGSVAKLGTTELMWDHAQRVADRAGPAAMLDGAESYGLTSAPGARIAGGTSEIQRNIIGERILGLPREPRPEGG